MRKTVDKMFISSTIICKNHKCKHETKAMIEILRVRVLMGLSYLSTINETAIPNVKRVHDKDEDDCLEDGSASVPKHEGCKDELR